MVKLNRIYELIIETRDGGTIEIQPPFTLEFDVRREIWGQANVATFRIFNLNQYNRNNLRFNQFDAGIVRQITFSAGYGPQTPQGNNLALAFFGNITSAFSVREGSNFITQIEAQDQGYAFVNSKSNFSLPAGTPLAGVIEALLNDLSGYGVSPGVIGNFLGTLQRGNAFGGNTIDLLKEITGGSFFIDNGVAHCLNDDEAFLGELPVINSAAGLLGTPQLEQACLKFDILFEPRLVCGQQLLLESITESNYNTYYKVIGLNHKGMISAAVCGDARTTISVAGAPAGFNAVILP